MLCCMDPLIAIQEYDKSTAVAVHSRPQRSALSTGLAPMYYDSALTRTQRATYQFSDKVHTRVLYKGVASPIYNVKRLADSLRILQ
jgi:hypothetical protein